MLENEEINEELDILEKTDAIETDVTEEVTSDDIDPVKKKLEDQKLERAKIYEARTINCDMSKKLKSF